SQAITQPANTAIIVVAPFTGQDIDADFVVRVAEQARTVGAEQAAAAERRAAEALEAARLAREAADRAAAEVKPAFEAAAEAAKSSAAAARSAADAQKAAAEAAADGAAARSAAARANQADAQAREDARKARAAANAAANDARIAGRSAAAAESDAAAARSAATRAEADAAAARGAADRAEIDAAAAQTAADSAQKHADGAAEAAKNAYNAAVDAGKAADRAEEAERKRNQELQKAAVEAVGGDPGVDLSQDDDGAFRAACRSETKDVEACVAQYKKAHNDAKSGLIDFIIQNGGQILLDEIGYTDAKKCFSEGDVAACLWTVINVGSLLVLIAKLPQVASAIAKIVAGLAKFLEASAVGRRMLDKFSDLVEKYRSTCKAANRTQVAPAVMADGQRRSFEGAAVSDRAVAANPGTVINCLDAVLDTEGKIYVVQKHFIGGKNYTPDKSTFDPNVNLDELVEAANDCDCRGPNADGHFERDVDAGQIIGNISVKHGGTPTTWYKVVQDKFGSVRTMYPIPAP
ncbi:hypothetical protein ACFFUZ_22025, partial [Kibdelosporangium philippinense]